MESNSNYEQVQLLNAEIDATNIEITRLSTENQGLDLKSPQDYDKILRNADQIELLVSRTEILRGRLERAKTRTFNGPRFTLLVGGLDVGALMLNSTVNAGDNE